MTILCIVHLRNNGQCTLDTPDLIESILSIYAVHTILYLVQPSGSQYLAIELSSSVLECSSSRLAPHVASSNQHLSQILEVEQVSICYQIQVLIVVVQKSAVSYTNSLSWSSISNPFSVQLEFDKREKRALLRPNPSLMSWSYTQLNWRLYKQAH